jgi:mRNA-degrading endonuclease RelE of RelBE toxin-antitoxin system
LLKYRIEYSPETEEHFQCLSKRQQVIVLDAVEKHLQFQPDIETRNRKPMRPNPLAPWELRIGSLRVYYDFEDSPERVVFVRAIGIKERNNVRIGREVIKL